MYTSTHRPPPLLSFYWHQQRKDVSSLMRLPDSVPALLADALYRTRARAGKLPAAASLASGYRCRVSSSPRAPFP